MVRHLPVVRGGGGGGGGGGGDGGAQSVGEEARVTER